MTYKSGISVVIKTFSLILVLIGSLSSANLAMSQIDSSTYSEAQSAILSANRDASAVQILHNIPAVGVIIVRRGYSYILGDGGESVATLILSAEKSHSEIAKLRAALLTNPVTRTALKVHGIVPSRVIGVRISTNGSLRIFIL